MSGACGCDVGVKGAVVCCGGMMWMTFGIMEVVAIGVVLESLVGIGCKNMFLWNLPIASN